MLAHDLGETVKYLNLPPAICLIIGIKRSPGSLYSDGVAHLRAQSRSHELEQFGFGEPRRLSARGPVGVDKLEDAGEVVDPQAVAPLPGRPSEFELRRSDERFVPVQHRGDLPITDKKIPGVVVAV